MPKKCSRCGGWITPADDSYVGVLCRCPRETGTSLSWVGRISEDVSIAEASAGRLVYLVTGNELEGWNCHVREGRGSWSSISPLCQQPVTFEEAQRIAEKHHRQNPDSTNTPSRE